MEAKTSASLWRREVGRCKTVSEPNELAKVESQIRQMYTPVTTSVGASSPVPQTPAVSELWVGPSKWASLWAAYSQEEEVWS